MDDDKTLDVTIDGSSGLVTSTISFFSLSIGIIAIALSPALAEKVKDWLKRWVNQGKITPKECSRMMDSVKCVVRIRGCSVKVSI
jgi:hypothetical protein